MGEGMPGVWLADVVMLPAFYVYMDFSLWYTARRWGDVLVCLVTVNF